VLGKREGGRAEVVRNKTGKDSPCPVGGRLGYSDPELSGHRCTFLMLKVWLQNFLA
jgi:hypothetical protein